MDRSMEFHYPVPYIIALCQVIKDCDFSQFEERLVSALAHKYNGTFVNKLGYASHGVSRLFDRKARKFYNENKEVIDLINKNHRIGLFIDNCFDPFGVPRESFLHIKRYIMDNKNEIDKMLAIAQKIDELGFVWIEFNEGADFLRDKYLVNSSFELNRVIYYVNNLEIIPNYTGDIYYTGTDYEMEVPNPQCTLPYGSIYIVPKIHLASLLFDVNILPSDIDAKKIFDEIMVKRTEQDKQFRAIRNSVSLGTSVMDLEKQLATTTDVITRLNGVKNKEELLHVLLSISNDVEKLHDLSMEYDKSVTDDDGLVTPKVLEKNKKKFLISREWAKLD